MLPGLRRGRSGLRAIASGCRLQLAIRPHLSTRAKTPQNTKRSIAGHLGLVRQQPRIDGFLADFALWGAGRVTRTRSKPSGFPVIRFPIVFPSVGFTDIAPQPTQHPATTKQSRRQSAFRRGCVKTAIYAMLPRGLEALHGRCEAVPLSSKPPRHHTARRQRARSDRRPIRGDASHR